MELDENKLNASYRLIRAVSQDENIVVYKNVFLDLLKSFKILTNDKCPDKDLYEKIFIIKYNNFVRLSKKYIDRVEAMSGEEVHSLCGKINKEFLLQLDSLIKINYETASVIKLKDFYTDPENADSIKELYSSLFYDADGIEETFNRNEIPMLDVNAEYQKLINTQAFDSVNYFSEQILTNNASWHSIMADYLSQIDRYLASKKEENIIR